MFLEFKGFKIGPIVITTESKLKNLKLTCDLKELKDLNKKIMLYEK